MAAWFAIRFPSRSDDFTSKSGVPNMYGLVQGVRNAIAPGKQPLSSMTPTTVTRNGPLRMVTGSPGGWHIITIVLETMLNALVYGMSAQEAVGPRTALHSSIPSAVSLCCARGRERPPHARRCGDGLLELHG